MTAKYFSGRGQFGITGRTTDSMWGNATLAEDLHIGRETELPGTTMAIVGFHNPAAPTEEPDVMAKRLSVAWQKWFWPALRDNKISVAVETAENRGDPTGTTVDPTETRAFLVDAYDRFRRDEVVEELRDPGDVVVKDIELRVPRRRDRQHGEIVHKAKLVVRLAAEGDDYSNQVAFFRQPGMVVEHLTIPEAQTGGAPFHAFLACGLAAGAGTEDRAAEEFLRASEPPAHDKWERTDDIVTIYAEGGIQALRDLKDNVRKEVRHLFARESLDSDEGPESIKRLLQIGGRPPSQDKPHVKSLRGRIENGQWLVEADISMNNRAKGWSFEPLVEFVGDSRNERVRWETLEAIKNCVVTDGHVIVRPSGRRKSVTVTIKGRTDSTTQLIPAEHAAITMTFRGVSRAEVD